MTTWIAITVLTVLVITLGLGVWVGLALYSVGLIGMAVFRGRILLRRCGALLVHLLKHSQEPCRIERFDENARDVLVAQQVDGAALLVGGRAYDNRRHRSIVLFELEIDFQRIDDGQTQIEHQHVAPAPENLRIGNHPAVKGKELRVLLIGLGEDLRRLGVAVAAQCLRFSEGIRKNDRALTIRIGTYPLGRDFYIYLDDAPGRAPSPLVREFVRYVLSKEGQAVVLSGGFLPLDEGACAPGRARVD